MSATVNTCRVDAFGDFDPLAPKAIGISAAAPAAEAKPSLGDSDLAAVPAAALPAALLPSRSRSQRRRDARKKQLGGGAGASGAPSNLSHGSSHGNDSSAPGLGAPPPARVAAPWEEDPEVEAAEQREANRAALRKALKNKRMQRSTKFALGQADASAENGTDTTAAAGPALPAGVDAKMIQALLRKTGHATADAPSMRKLRRAMQAMPAGYLAALGAAAGK